MQHDEIELRELTDRLYTQILTLNERIWEDQARRPLVDRWLRNFSNGDESSEKDRLHALYLLSRFTYFGDRELRELLRATFRDLYKYPIVANLRRSSGDTLDQHRLQHLFEGELHRTRFLGIGNPSESGTHLLYYFRQENELPARLFINPHEIFDRIASSEATVRDPTITRYVFLDDFCGTGKQASEYSASIVLDLKRSLARENLSARISYYVLCATQQGIAAVRKQSAFDEAHCVLELDDSFKCFGPTSRYFRQETVGIDIRYAKYFAKSYGSLLKPDHPLGFEDGQLLLGFHHNTPDNALPIIWYDGRNCPAWEPIFRRYPKIAYSGQPREER